MAANSISSSAAFMLAAPAEVVDSGHKADESCDSGEKFNFEHCIVLSLELLFPYLQLENTTAAAVSQVLLCKMFVNDTLTLPSRAQCVYTNTTCILQTIPIHL